MMAGPLPANAVAAWEQAKTIDNVADDVRSMDPRWGLIPEGMPICGVYGNLRVLFGWKWCNINNFHKAFLKRRTREHDSMEKLRLSRDVSPWRLAVSRPAGTI